jgi:arylsulfatase A-like enzyme
MDRNTDPARWTEYWKPHLEDFQRVYHAMTASLDWNIGRVLKALHDKGLEDDTIVVFTSDHGEMFGAHGRIFKMTFYDEAVRVPMLIRWPGRIPARRVSDACMATPDIMPTLLGLLDLPIPSRVEGVDLSHLAEGKPGPEPPFAFLQGMGHTYLWEDGFEWRAVRDRRYTYAVYRSDGRELLFDNLNDPHQARDLSGDAEARDVLSTMRTNLRERMRELNDTFERCSWYRDHWTENRVILRGAKGVFHREMGPDVPVERERE